MGIYLWHIKTHIVSLICLYHEVYTLYGGWKILAFYIVISNKFLYDGGHLNSKCLLMIGHLNIIFGQVVGNLKS